MTDVNPALAVDLSKILDQPAEKKATQIPTPSTYHLLCMVPQAEEEYESGLVKAGNTMHYE